MPNHKPFIIPTREIHPDLPPIPDTDTQYLHNLTLEAALRLFAILTIDALPNTAHETTAGTISTHTAEDVLINNVHAVPQNAAFECPKELLNSRVHQGSAAPDNYNRINNWSEDHLTAIVSPLLVYLLQEIGHRFKLTNLDGVKAPVDKQGHTPDFVIKQSGRKISFTEFKAPKVVANPGAFGAFPFGSVTPSLTLTTTFSALFTQLVLYARGVRTGNPRLINKDIVAILTVFPAYVYVVLFRFDSMKEEPDIFVSRNLLGPDPTTGVVDPEILIMKFFDQVAVFNWFKAMCWALNIVAYHVHKDSIDKSLVDDPHYLATNGPIVTQLRLALSALGEVPRYSLTTKLMRFIGSICQYPGTLLGFLFLLRWRSPFLTQMRLNRAPKVLLGHQTLIMEHSPSKSGRFSTMYRMVVSSQLKLYQGVHWRSFDDSKHFSLYRHCNLFVKVYAECAKAEFVAECKLYNECKALQGNVIPRLYGSGNVEGSKSTFIITSYAGEPLKEWDRETRINVQKLVRRLHKAGFHHHDIRRDNVVVDRKGHLTLIDFGFSAYKCPELSCDTVE